LSTPYFSVVIPTYNRASLISKTLATVFEQTFQEFEVIVVDDGSTDNTEEVVRGFKDNRLRYFKRPNAERGASRNFGASQATGRYINFFDSDDLMYPHHLATAAEKAKEWNEPEFFHLGYDFKTPEGVVFKVVDNLDESLPAKVLVDNVLSCNGVVVRRDVWTHYQFEEKRVLASAEDWELWIRLISRFHLYFSNAVTTSVVAHDLRSIRVINPDKVVERDLFLIKALKSDPEVMRVYGDGFKRFVADRYTYIMLCLAEAGRRQDVIRWAFRTLAVSPAAVLSARYLASIKKTILP
jgi:glycosyltransferase involved in cell wall biosynthesis